MATELKPRAPTSESRLRRSTRQVGWFAAIWALSVLALAAVAWLIRAAIL